MKNICVLYITSAFRLRSEVIQSDKHCYLCQTNSRTRKMIQVKSAIQQYQGHCDVQIAKCARGKRVCPIGFRWRVRKRLINRHDKTGVGKGSAHKADFARYGLLEHDAAYCGTDLPTFRWKLLALSSLV